MRWLGKVIGGTVGLGIGGPAGGVIGGGLGAVVDHALDGPPKSDLPEIEAEGQFSDDDQGRFAQIKFPPSLPAGAIAVAVVETRQGRSLSARKEFNREGRFLIRQPVKRGRVSFYIPFSALKYRRKGIYVLRLTVRVATPGGHGVEALGQCAFECPLPKPMPWRQVEYLDGLVGLCAATAHSDGPPDKLSLALVQNFFLQTMQLPAAQSEQLAAMLNSPPTEELELLCKRVLRRLPEIRPMTVLGLMSEVARAGSVPSRQTRILIRDAAEHLGIPGHRWPEVQKRLQLVIHDPWSTLGLQPGATTQEVKKAYRTKLKGLHPDRVSGLDNEIQELAEARTIELRQAYEACLDAVS
jgi:hypothetical protein